MTGRPVTQPTHTSRPESPGRDWRVVGVVTGLVALIGIAIVTTIVWLVPLRTTTSDDPPAASGITLEAVIEDPDDFITEQVSVAGTIDERIAPNAFTLEGPATGDDELLVIVAEPHESTSWDEGQAAEVSGVVRRFQIPFLEETLGTRLDRDTFEPYLGQPAIIAERVTEATQGDVVSGGGVLSPEGLEERYDDLLGESVVVRGEVEEALTPTVFSYDDGSILVVLEEPSDQLTDDAIALIEGEAAPFDPDRAASHAGGDLPIGDLDDLAGRPAVYATEIDVLDALEEIGEEPARFIGDEVAVLGGVGEILGPNGFVFERHGVLVVTTGAGADLAPQADARVTGIVQIFDIASIEQATGEDLDDEVFRDFLGEPTIIANAIKVYR